MARFKGTILLLSFVVVAPLVVAQGSESTKAAPAESNTRAIEEITVRGERTMAAVRYQLRLAEDDLYRMFNDLNSTDDFDITCKNISYTRTHIRRRTCEPKFLTRRRQNNATFVMRQLRDELDNGIASSGTLGLNFNAIGDHLEEETETRVLLSAQFEAMGEDMIRIATENPNYLKALMQVDSLNSELTALWETRFGN